MLMDETTTEQAESSLADETYRTLLADILAARLAGGTVVQERRLAMKLGVSRSPMRDALGRLEGQGLLIRNAKGVLSVRVITLQDYLNSLAMRMLIEPSATALACPNLCIDKLDQLSGLLDVIDNDPDPSPSDVWFFDDELHGYIGEQSGNPFMSSTIQEMRRYTTIFERQMSVIRPKPGISEHRAIIEALARQDAGAARLAMSNHLERVRQGVLSNY
jgi:DNA-binding GntR family transcriptional regulator